MRRLIVLGALALAACANFGDIRPGSTRADDMIARFGQPASERQLPDGSRALDYPREPEGMENWRVTVGPDGIVRNVEQLVDEPTFVKIVPGLTRNEVLAMLGPDSEEKTFRNLGEEVLSWRYMDFGNLRMQFNAHFDASGRLKYTTRTPDASQNTGGENTM